MGASSASFSLYLIYRYYLQTFEVQAESPLSENLMKKAAVEQKIRDAEAHREEARLARETRRNEEAAAAAANFAASLARGNKLAEAPDGVPSILSWTQREDGKLRRKSGFVCCLWE